MDQLVLYISEDLPDPAIKHAGSATVETVYYKRDFIEAMVDQPGLVGAAVCLKNTDTDWEQLLQSVARSFPLLPLLLVTAESNERKPEDPATLSRSRLDEEKHTVDRVLSQFVKDTRSRDRREYYRYDFPIRARLHAEEEPVHEIRQLSAGGAFLKPNGPAPKGNSSCEIELMFQNFSINTTCRILDSRQTSSNAEPGFGIQFTALSPAATSYINKMVQDALVQVLTDPESDPAVPTLDEDEDLLSIGDEFTLAI